MKREERKKERRRRGEEAGRTVDWASVVVGGFWVWDNTEIIITGERVTWSSHTLVHHQPCTTLSCNMINYCDGDASSGGLCQCQWMQLHINGASCCRDRPSLASTLNLCKRLQGMVRPPNRRYLRVHWALKGPEWVVNWGLRWGPTGEGLFWRPPTGSESPFGPEALLVSELVGPSHGRPMQMTRDEPCHRSWLDGSWSP